MINSLKFLPLSMLILSFLHICIIIFDTVVILIITLASLFLAVAMKLVIVLECQKHSLYTTILILIVIVSSSERKCMQYIFFWFSSYHIIHMVDNMFHHGHFLSFLSCCIFIFPCVCRKTYVQQYHKSTQDPMPCNIMCQCVAQEIKSILLLNS